MKFPEKGRSIEQLLEELEQKKVSDLKWKKGRAFSYIYHVSEQVSSSLYKAYECYFSENALNPSAFPSLSEMQSEVIAMCKSLFHGKASASGVMTSGGTESILMAVKAAKEYAKKQRNITRPEIVMSISGHPAFNKACDYFGIELKILPVDDHFKAVPEAYRQAITENTIMLVASAPAYPQGVVDPVPELSAIALEHAILLHVDACVGGFVLPFISKGNFPAFDFSLPGVSSISADIHKYGFASKGSSVVLYRDNEVRKSQFYIYTDWPGGIYASPSVMGTRPGGAIAVAWTILKMLGKEGYMELVNGMMSTTKELQEFLCSFDGIYVLGQPDMCIFSITADGLNIYELGDEMHEMGWLMDRQQNPPALHLSISPIHSKVLCDFKKDFETAYRKATTRDLNSLKNRVQVGAVKSLSKILPNKTFSKIQKIAVQKGEVNTTRSAALYGMIGDLRGSGTLDDMIIEFLDKMTK